MGGISAAGLDGCVPVLCVVPRFGELFLLVC